MSKGIWMPPGYKVRRLTFPFESYSIGTFEIANTLFLPHRKNSEISLSFSFLGERKIISFISFNLPCFAEITLCISHPPVKIKNQNTIQFPNPQVSIRTSNLFSPTSSSLLCSTPSRPKVPHETPHPQE